MFPYFEILRYTNAAFGVSQKFVAYRGNSSVSAMNKRVRFTCTSTDYEFVTGLNFSIPADTFVRVTASLRFSNSAPRGIKIIDVDMNTSDPNNAVSCINETDKNYGGITASAILMPTGTARNYAVYSKSSAAAGNDVLLTVEYL